MSHKKENTIKKVSEYERAFNERITQPIPSFAGKKPTSGEHKLIAAMVKYFEK